MLYLAGQILVFVLLAMLVGAALAWIFLIAPLRRRAAAAAAAAAGDSGSPDVRSAEPRSFEEAVSRPEAVRSSLLTGVDTARPDAAGTGATGADAAENGAAENAVAEPDSAEVRSARTVVAAGQATVSAPDEQTTADQLAELTLWLRRQEDSSALTKADLTARLAVAEQQAIEAEQRVAATERELARAQERIEQIERALAALTASAPVASAGADGAAAADGHTVAPMDTVAPVDTVDADVSLTADAPAKQRLADQDLAARRVNGRTDADGGQVGETPSAADLARETERLRIQLREAEDRAAKFSARLAMVRTEAEEAQRQVATMSTRLDRHQAEWAAERISLLARITEADSARGTDEDDQPAAGADPSGTGESQDADRSGAEAAAVADEPTMRAAAPDDRSDQHQVGQDQTDQNQADQGRVNQGQVGPGHGDGAGAAQGARRRRRGPGGVRTAGASRARRSAGRDERRRHPDADHEARRAAGWDVPDRPLVTRRPGGPGERTAKPRRPQSAPVWGRLAEPVSSGDNLKEIVGIGPVTEARLHALGITTFRQLATMGDTEVEDLAARLDGFGDRIVSDDWVGQAKELHIRYHGGLA